MRFEPSKQVCCGARRVSGSSGAGGGRLRGMGSLGGAGSGGGEGCPCGGLRPAAHVTREGIRSQVLGASAQGVGGALGGLGQPLPEGPSRLSAAAPRRAHPRSERSPG